MQAPCRPPTRPAPQCRLVSLHSFCNHSIPAGYWCYAVRAGLIAGGAGDDGIYLGDQITEFDNVSVRGGKGNDAVGTFNSGAQYRLPDRSVGWRNEGGDGNDTIFVTLSAESGTDGNLLVTRAMTPSTSLVLTAKLIPASLAVAGNDSIVMNCQQRLPPLQVAMAMTPLTLLSAVTTNVLVKGRKFTGVTPLTLPSTPTHPPLFMAGLATALCCLVLPTTVRTFSTPVLATTPCTSSLLVLSTLSGSTVVGGAGATRSCLRQLPTVQLTLATSRVVPVTTPLPCPTRTTSALLVL